MIGLGIGVSRLRRRGGGGIPDLLYNQYGVPAAGFSTRLNDKNYTGGLMDVIAYDGSTQQGSAGVLPYDTGDGYWVDLNSKLINLDATATGRGLTDSDTLGDLVDAGGADYNGLVPTWYGQAGGIDATQSSLGAMPRIVDAGALEVENGRPAIYADGTKTMNIGMTSGGDLTIYFLHKLIGASGRYHITIGGSSNNVRITQIDTDANRFNIVFSGNSLLGGIPSYDQEILTSEKSLTQLCRLFQNKVEISYTNQNVSNEAIENLQLFGTGTFGLYNGYAQEVSIYPEARMTDKENIEDNCINAYNITT